MLKKNLQRAFYYLKFPSFHKVLLKIKHGFGDVRVLPNTIQNLMKQRLKQEVNKMTGGHTICEILEKGLYKKLQLHKNGHQYSFIQNYENTVDSLITKGWIQVILSLNENGYLEAVIVNPKKSLPTIFVESASNASFLPLSTHENILDKNLHFFKLKVLYRAQFPFSWNYHIWFITQTRGSYLWWKDTDNWIHRHIIGLNTHKNKAIVDEEILITVYCVKKIMHFNGKLFSLLKGCDEEECAMYTKDVIRGIFHRYIPIQANDDVPDIVKGIVFLIGGIVIEQTSMKINIPLIEAIFYYLEDVIENYIQLLSLCDDQEIRSSIKQLFTIKYSPLIQMIKATSKLSSYFLWHPSQMNDIDNMPHKISLACDALQIIANFLCARCSEEKEYQDFLSVYRQLQIKILDSNTFGQSIVIQTHPTRILLQ
ncbi:hypothetical protein RFI_05108 [Reticulomyxa filosa]|uniref:Uncharacterized protein n=1 Tax=Reticulomyxa filosa TaxID=46433 RepID=X6P1I8_RETFI|nr:hypothetical protein RFI_05108 [Reticulomyxa filosa]|eukprot:ETO32008.1 hypothetical protein RFI_05108 [Reticulomyxa filosa]